MKKFVIVFFAFMISVLNAFKAQNSTCQFAQQVCPQSLAYPATVNNYSSQTGPNYGCLGSTPNPSWFYMEFASGGNLDAVISGSVNGSQGQDVDFICWGPFPSLTNACNNLTAGNIVDCSYSSSFTETLNISNATTGDFYIFMVTNYSNIQQSIVINPSGNGILMCYQLSAPSACAGQQTTLTINQQMLSNPIYTMIPSNATFTTSTYVFSPTTSAIYTINCSGLNNQNTMQAISQTVAVTVNPYPVLNVSNSSPTICSGQSATLNASGANSYSWNTGGMQNAEIVTPSVTTSYTVQGSIANCTSGQTVVVNVNPNPVLNITSSSPAICPGQSATLTVGGANSYSWSTGSVLTTEVVSPSVTTSYSVQGFIANCSSSVSITQSVSVCTGLTESRGQLFVLSVYPNPADNRISLNHGVLQLPISAYVTNSLGITTRLSVAEDLSIVVSALPVGVYTLVLEDGKKQYAVMLAVYR